MQTNCYLVFDEKSQKGIIIDPGEDADYIQQIILDNGIIPMLIIATHGHFDHILAVSELKLAFKIPFLIHKKDEFLVKSMKKRAEFFLKTKVDPNPSVDGFLEEGREISVGKNNFVVLETAGHTPGSISLFCDEEKIVFSGDLIFADGTYGKNDHKYSDPDKMLKSVWKIQSLPESTTLYPGHGEQFKLRLAK